MATKNHRPISFKDVTLYCVSCGESFVFGPRQQITFADRGWLEPRYCPNCRGKKHRQKHRQVHKQVPMQEQPSRLAGLDEVLNKARELIARYRGEN